MDRTTIKLLPIAYHRWAVNLPSVSTQRLTLDSASILKPQEICDPDGVCGSPEAIKPPVDTYAPKGTPKPGIGAKISGPVHVAVGAAGHTVAGCAIGILATGAATYFTGGEEAIANIDTDKLDFACAATGVSALWNWATGG